MKDSQIQIKVELDEQKIPEKILWTSAALEDPAAQEAKAMLISFWDGRESTAMRLDLWTKDMRVDEMADFFYQTFMSLSDTYHRAVQDSNLHLDMQKFAIEFQQKFKSEQLKK